MKHDVYTLALLMILLVSVASGGVPGGQPLIIEGTGDSQVILGKLARLFEREHPGSRVIVPESVGSGGGIKALIRGRAGLARTARPLKTKEKADGLIQIPFAWSPVVFAAHPSGDLPRTLTLDQVLKVYRGDIVNWQDLGGPDHKLYPVAREEGDSSRTIVDTYLTSVLGRPSGLGPVGKIFYTTGETVQALMRNAFSFGYLPFSCAREGELHVFALNNTFPNEAGIRGKTYPLVTTFYLVRTGQSQDLALSFLAFMDSAPAREIMRTSGVFPADHPY